MDVMDEGLLEFWRVLNKHNVQYKDKLDVLELEKIKKYLDEKGKE